MSPTSETAVQAATADQGRRDFLKAAAGTVAAVVVVPLVAQGALAQAAPAAHVKHHDSFPLKGQMAHRYAMVIDLRRCIGCHACSVACKSENTVPLGVFRTRVFSVESGTYPDTRPRYLPVFCNHCDQPPCVPVCPVLATYKRDDGLVLIDANKCIGCGYCVQACPYGARHVNPLQRTADKCTLCAHRLEAGQEPACVATCIGRALTVGDLNDPGSEVSKLVAAHPVQTLKPEFGTDPMFFYIGLDGRLAREATL